jgi:hypothetical protein
VYCSAQCANEAILLAVSVFWCSSGAPTQEEAEQNIHLAHGFQKAGIIERDEEFLAGEVDDR